MLQRESDACYGAVDTDTDRAATAVTAQGCVLDVMATCPIRDGDPARVNAKHYLNARAKQLEKTVGNQSLDDRNVFSSLLFERLPEFVGQLVTARTEQIHFFNEHYVVKPPRSHVEFRWHRDDDEQLAMCLHRDTILPYVSAWCALDDVTTTNGALQFVSLDQSNREIAINELGRHASDPVLANAGDVLFFLSNVWHCSSSNESDQPRRAFYAQYSRGRITAGPNDPSPLSFAISSLEVDESGLPQGVSEDGNRDKSTRSLKRRTRPDGNCK